jgi:predicted amidohydrolase
MRLTIVQTSLVWQNAAANRNLFTQKLASLAGVTDLVVLPEMFTTGFSMETALLAEPMDGPTVQWMQHTAHTLQAAVTGSFICRENGQYYNRLLFVYPDGRYSSYDKKHLFGLAGEHLHFATNNKKLVVEWKGFRIMPLICYDLRFPVWSRNNPQEPYDMLLYVANWPKRRAHHWRALLTARAIENQSFVVGVNIFGADGNGLEYSGDSTVIDFSGEQLCQISGVESVVTTEIGVAALHEFRRQLPFLHDADTFRLTAG